MALTQTIGFLAKSTYRTIRRPQLNRVKSVVLDEYNGGWDQYRRFLERADTIEEWLRIAGLEDSPDFYNVDGRVTFEAFDSAGYYRKTLLDTLRRHFPGIRSITEYGCGVGRNLLFLKRAMPELECYGYELCQPGVEIAKEASRKFQIDVKYSQLDYLEDSEAKYVFPQTDVAFTMFSLEQLPRNSDKALDNMLRHVVRGTIHMEPVPENYPLSLRGVLGRIEHRRVDYLGDFDRAARSRPVRKVQVEPMRSAHNPLMFPSIYILHKT